MKICCIADTHYGERGDNVHLLNYQSKFFDKVFFPIVEREKPDMFLHLGDLVHNRKSLNLYTHHRLERDFLDGVEINFKSENCYYIVGNHDCFYKQSLEVNAQDLLQVEGNVIDRPVLYKGFSFIPWICNENREETLEFIKSFSSKYCFGHLELAGFQHGSTISRGDDPALLSNFENVLSGHFHTRSRIGNIRYVGSPFDFRWDDFGQWRGFSIIDTEKEKITWIRNPFNIFSVIHYNEENIPNDLLPYKDTYCRLFVMNKTSETKFQDFVKKIKDQGVINLDIIEHEVTAQVDGAQIRFIDNQEDIFVEHIKNLDYHDPEGVELMFRELYDKAKRGILS